MKRVLWLVVLLVSSAGPCLAQSETAMLTGRVTDQTGAVLVGATVTVTNQATGVERVTFTNEAGRYVVAGLIPGVYRIVVTLDGFAQVVKTGVELRVQDNVAENFELRIGSLAESTTVQANPVRVAGAPAVVTSIDPTFVSRIPLNGRTIQSLLALAPGMVTTQTGDVGQISSNGLRTTMNAFYIDGVSANIGVALGAGSPGYSGPGVAGFSTLGTTSNLVSVDALQEFTVQTSTYSAEFGRQPGAQVSMTTRSGTNDFRGSAFHYFRDDALDATDWFVKRDKLQKPQARTNNWGGTLGGPIVRNRTFFFASFEQLRLQVPNTMTSEVLARWVRDQAAPALRPYVDATPLPTGPDNLTTGRAPFVTSYSDPSRLDAASGRVDHVFSSNVNVFARYNYSPSWSVTHPSPIYRNKVRMRTQTLTGGATMVFSPTLTNVVRVNWSDNRGTNAFLPSDFAGATPVSDEALAIGGIDPSVSRGFVNFINGAGGVWGGYNGVNRSRQFNATSTLTLARRTHTFKVGVDYRRFSPELQPALYDVNAQFTTPASVASGVATFVLVNYWGPGRYSYDNFSAFGQDSWRVTDRLTLDYGLRWDLNPPPHIKPEPILVNGAPNFKTATLGEPGQSLYDTQWSNFAPRVGGAYRLRTAPNWETIVRGGYGLFYDIGAGAPATLTAQFPYSNSALLASQPFPFPTITLPPVSLTPPYPATAYLARYTDDYVSPRIHQWNVAVEQALGSLQRLSLTYSGNAGRRLLRRSTMTNQAYGNPLFATTATFYNTTNSPELGDRSDYAALQAQFFHRSRALQAIVSYTLARAKDTNASDVNTAAIADPGFVGWLQPAGEYSYSALDRRHNFSGAVTVDLPAAGQDGGLLNLLTAGWTMDWVVQAQSGRPININYLWTVPGVGISYQLRPDLVPGVPIWIDDPFEPRGKRLNPAAFSVPANPGERAPTLPRNSIRGFGYWQADVSLGRQFRITRDVRVRVRAEVFNAFNVANFRNPSPTMGIKLASGVFSPIAAFGRTTQMLNRATGGASAGNDQVNTVYALGGPRAVQLSLRVTF